MKNGVDFTPFFMLSSPENSHAAFGKALCHMGKIVIPFTLA